MKVSDFISFILLIVIIGCDQNTSQTPVPTTTPANIIKKSKSPAAFCYILCDFSASQGDRSRQLIIQNADTIFKSSCNKEYKFKYYNISSPEFESPFFEAALTSLPSISKGSERKIFQEKFISIADSLHKTMMKLLQSPSSNTTCIVRTIDKIAKSLAAEAPGNQAKPIKIVILSDMLEDCMYSSGKIDIDHGYYDIALKVLAKMPKPKFTFLNYKNNIDIRLVASSERSINSDALYDFWQKVFLKYDYELKSPIAVDLPAWIAN